MVGLGGDVGLERIRSGEAGDDEPHAADGALDESGESKGGYFVTRGTKRSSFTVAAR